MDQMFQPIQKSSEQLPHPSGPGETLPHIIPVEKAPVPEKGEHQHVGSAGAAVQQAYADDTTTIVTPLQQLAQNDAAVEQRSAQLHPASADIDVIEKEWVEKAKKIVSITKDDPREQSKELTGMKREYIEKRFGKSLPDNRAA